MAKIDIVKAKITYLQIMMVLLFGANIGLIRKIFIKIETLGDYES